MARLEAGVVLKSGDESVKDRFSRGIEVRLPSEALGNPGDLTFLTRRAVAAGEYEAIAVVRDLDSGDVGALRIRVTIPALSPDHLAMSSLVLSSLASPARRIDLDPPDPEERPQAVPAVTRTFTRSDKVTGSTSIYHPLRDLATGEARVTVRCRIRRGTEIVREFSPHRHLLTAGERLTSIPLEFPVDASDLAPGIYDLQVEAWDEVDGRGVVQRVEFIVR
ncbi:MAG TPA: hypothetical protein VKL61_07680 [Candidatus Polarisedimenticolia bacterium]|nr:hypothetical protein [Candidatus Polarisedimenticolia bacterium]